MYSHYLNYYSHSKSKKCFDANIYKLKALAINRLNQNFDRVLKLLNDAYEIFENEDIYHGMALISFI